MEVFALLFASKYGIAALGSVTLALGMQTVDAGVANNGMSHACVTPQPGSTSGFD